MKQTLKNKLAKLNNPQDADYTLSIRQIIFNDTQSKIPSDYLNIIEDPENNILIRFAAFYSLFTQYRRFEQRFNLFDLVDKYIILFSDDKFKYLCEIVWSQYYKFKCLDSANKEFYRQAISHSEQAIKCYGILSNNIGCFNNFADIVLESLAIKNLVSDRDVVYALQYIDRSIYILEIERKELPNPQYYYRKAKLLSFQKKYEEAKKAIALAISYSKPDDKESLIRIANYHNTQLEIKTEEALNIVDLSVNESITKYKDLQKQMDQQQIRYIEILGFFASTIALITGSISLTMNFTEFNMACGLIISLTGCLIMAYISLKILFSSQVDMPKTIFLFMLSLSIIAIGYLIGNGFVLTWIDQL